MAEHEDDPTTVPVPGEDLQNKIIKIAIKLAQKPSAEAEGLISRLASKKGSERPYLVEGHTYYPYFRLQYETLRSEGVSADLAAAATGKAKDTEEDIVIEGERNEELRQQKRKEHLADAEKESKGFRTDPLPRIYSLELDPGVSIPRAVFDYISATAQYVAKYGEAFLVQARANHQTNTAFKFLKEDDPHHRVFLRLVDTYKQILLAPAAAVEERLTPYEEGGDALDDLLKQKRDFLKAEAARKRAILLTDDELKKRLTWNRFAVVASYNIADLGFAETDEQKEDEHQHAGSSNGWAEAEEDAGVQGIQKDNEVSYLNPTGEVVRGSELGRKAGGLGEAETMLKREAANSNKVPVGFGGADEQFEANLRRGH